MTPKEDERTIEQRRADMLVDAILSGLSGDLPAAHGLQRPGPAPMPRIHQPPTRTLENPRRIAAEFS
jgi:hypothetical protein